jgi:leader peptidase (prepilin peptidase) / N-methyltransferase
VEIIELLRASPSAFVVLSAVLGLIVGSFLNVVIHRLPRMLMARWRVDCQLLDAAPGSEAPPMPRYDLSHPASTCPACNCRIRAVDNIPVVSFVVLKGRCRSCGRAISPRYPAVELLTGLAFGLLGWQFGWGVEALAGWLLTGYLVALAGIDLDTQYLPDELTLPLLWAGLVLSVVVGRGAGLYPVSPAEAIVGAAVGYLSLWSVHHLFRLVTGREGFGYGDFKLLAALGAFGSWKVLLPIILLSALAGSIVGITLIAIGRHQRQQPMPYGPFLAAAGWLVLVFPHTLVTPWWPFLH